MKWCFALLVIFIWTSCTTLDVYEKHHFFSNYQWDSRDTISVQFEITDTTQPYRISLVLRHENAYAYKNIWIETQFNTPDSTYQVMREFTLADNLRWLGNRVDDIAEHRIRYNEQPFYLKKGVYKFRLKQVMREDPLRYIMMAGIRVEKVQP
jgi:gliding motility-associated lipoprotein GldH